MFLLDSTVQLAESWWFLPFRWLGWLPRPRLLPPVHLSKQPAVPGFPWSSWHHTTEPFWFTSCEVILWSNQALSGEGQHSYHSRRKSLQQQVASYKYLCGCTVWENFSQSFCSCFYMRCCFQVLVFSSQQSIPLRVLCCNLYYCFCFITLEFY